MREGPGTWITQYPLAIIAFAVLLAIAISALKLPIYPDEVAYKIFLERFFLNGGLKQSVTPYCGRGFLQEPSVVLVPAAATWALVERLGIDWQSYRILPAAAFCMCITLLSLNSLRQDSGLPWPALLLSAIGPTIYGLIIFRPEIFLLFGGLTIFFLLRRLVAELHPLTRVTLSIAAVFIYSLLAYLHPKSLYLLPLMAIGSIFSSRRMRAVPARITYLLFLAISVTWVSGSAINLHKAQFMECPEVPDIEQRMKVQAVNLMSVFSDTEAFVATLRQAASKDLLDKTISQLSFKASYESNYLPPRTDVTDGQDKLNDVNLAIVAIALLSAVLGPVLCRRALPWPENVLITSLAMAYFIPIALNLTRHWYDVSFLAGALMITNALYFPHFRSMVSRSPAASVAWSATNFVILIAAISTAFVIDRDFSGKFGQGYSGPGILLEVDRKLVKLSVDQLLTRNGLTNEGSIIVDDLTYDALKSRRIVVPITYLGVVGDDPIATRTVRRSLARYGVRYGVARCMFLADLARPFGFQLIDSVENVCLFSVASVEERP